MEAQEAESHLKEKFTILVVRANEADG
ncbi:uncharacterized protein G2W53_021612 [Senna tora]|uniref:Uncharacterized protein n=1 Tax=Senna tora TaxID=362788 RepID=A0A834TJT7_9FABA|nr:uncharacterized protein G2W53_021612 [Senna tora]